MFTSPFLSLRFSVEFENISCETLRHLYLDTQLYMFAEVNDCHATGVLWQQGWHLQHLGRHPKKKTYKLKLKTVALKYTKKTNIPPLIFGLDGMDFPQGFLRVVLSGSPKENPCRPSLGLEEYYILCLLQLFSHVFLLLRAQCVVATP